MTRFLLLTGLVAVFLTVNLLMAADVKKEDVPKLMKDLKSALPKVRATAAEDLGNLGAINASYVKDAIPDLMEMARKDKAPEARRAAVRALGKVDPDPKEAVPLLTESLKDKSDDVKIAAMQSLGQLGSASRSSMAQLREFAKEKDKDKRRLSQAAKDAMKRINAKE